MAYAEGIMSTSIAQAASASSTLVIVDPENFMKILARAGKSLIVHARGGIFKKNYQYLTAYKGLVFFTKSNTELILPGDAEIIISKGIWVPGIYQGGTY